MEKDNIRRKTEGNQVSKVRKIKRRKRKGEAFNPKFMGNGPKLIRSRKGLLSHLNFRKEFTEI